MQGKRKSFIGLEKIYRKVVMNQKIRDHYKNITCKRIF